MPTTPPFANHMFQPLEFNLPTNERLEICGAHK